MGSKRRQYPGQRISFRTDDLILRGMARAEEEGRSFSDYVSRLVEKDVADHSPPAWALEAARKKKEDRAKKPRAKWCPTTRSLKYPDPLENNVLVGNEMPSSSSDALKAGSEIADSAGKSVDVHRASVARSGQTPSPSDVVPQQSKTRPGGPGRAPKKSP